MEGEIKAIIFGLGEMGKRIAKGVLEKGASIVGAVDVAEGLVGKDLGEVLGLGRTLGVRVTGDAWGLLSKAEADLAIIATASHLEAIRPQLELCIRAGIDVISTCEELAYPHHKHPELSREIDELARRHGATVLGTGINPGFLMDALPIMLTGACQRVEGIKVVRVMDSSKRRPSYQRKIGTGLSPEEFRRMVDGKEITGHVGLAESIAMIASALGWKLDGIVEFPPEPILAERELRTPYATVGPGRVAGLRSAAHGIRGGRPAIALEFVSHAAVEEEYDSISIEGVPRICERIAGGVHGDLGTVGVIVNMIPKVLAAEPGLVTMKDLPLPSAVEDLRPPGPRTPRAGSLQ